MRPRHAAVGLLAAALVLGGAEASERVLDLAAPGVFPIEGDRPILAPEPPAPAATPPAPGGATATAPPSPTPFSLAPALAPLPSTTPAVRPLAPATFTVQVGAFRSADQAHALAERLTRRGYEAFVVTAERPTPGDRGVWYRVRVGRFPERQPAADLAARLVGSEKVPAQVLREAP